MASERSGIDPRRGYGRAERKRPDLGAPVPPWHRVATGGGESLGRGLRLAP